MTDSCYGNCQKVPAERDAALDVLRGSEPGPLIREVRAGFLALSPVGARIGIGVLGATEAEAREHYAKELEAWRELERRKPRHGMAPPGES